MTTTKEQYQRRYDELCAQRDAVNAANAAREAKLTKVNEQINKLQAEALAIASEIDDKRGREAWRELKTEIAMLARTLYPRRS